MYIILNPKGSASNLTQVLEVVLHFNNLISRKNENFDKMLSELLEQFVKPVKSLLPCQRDVNTCTGKLCITNRVVLDSALFEKQMKALKTMYLEKNDLEYKIDSVSVVFDNCKLLSNLSLQKVSSRILGILPASTVKFSFLGCLITGLQVDRQSEIRFERTTSMATKLLVRRAVSMDVKENSVVEIFSDAPISRAPIYESDMLVFKATEPITTDSEKMSKVKIRIAKWLLSQNYTPNHRILLLIPRLNSYYTTARVSSFDDVGVMVEKDDSSSVCNFCKNLGLHFRDMKEGHLNTPHPSMYFERHNQNFALDISSFNLCDALRFNPKYYTDTMDLIEITDDIMRLYVEELSNYS